MCAEIVSPEVWYRCEDIRYSSGTDEWGDPLPGPGRLEIRLYEYTVLRHTPKGVWINGGYSSRGRFVLRDANKRYACPTIEEARVSFLARKRRERDIHAARARQAAEAIRLMEPARQPLLGTPLDVSVVS